MSEIKETFESNSGHEKLPYILVAQNADGKKEIKITDLHVRTPGFRGSELVRNLNMTLSAGDRVILTGASGTGKTTVARALMNQWDYGSGLVSMPSGLKIMAMSQQPHFPNTTLRAILNMTPEEKCKYEDRELREVLQAVGRDILIQHIPGQQTEILMDGLVKRMTAIMRPYKKHDLTEDLASEMREKLLPRLREMTAEQFHYVQYVPDAQKDYLREAMQKMFSETLQMKAPQQTIDRAAAEIVRDIDIALVRPLEEKLEKALPEIAQNQVRGSGSETAAKASYFCWKLESKLHKYVKAYMNNEDTDDQAREIRINKTQAHHVIQSVAIKMRRQLEPHIREGLMTSMFNMVTSPVTAMWRQSANSAAKELVQRLTFFMDRQILTGDDFRSQQSGGEKQKLMIAAVLLHKPDVLILDEITAALDQETGEMLYKEMMDQLPKDTIVLSIAHNRHIMKYHTHHASLADQQITLRKLDPKEFEGKTCDSCPHAPVPGAPG